MTAEERRKASGPLIYWAAAAPAHRGAATVGAPFGAPPPALGSKDVLGSKDFASRPFEASFLGKRERRPGCCSHRGNAVPRRHCRPCGGDERTSALFRHRDSGGGGPLELAKRANRGGGGAGLGALLSVQKDGSDEVASLLCRKESSKHRVGV